MRKVAEGSGYGIQRVSLNLFRARAKAQFSGSKRPTKVGFYHLFKPEEKPTLFDANSRILGCWIPSRPRRDALLLQTAGARLRQLHGFGGQALIRGSDGCGLAAGQAHRTLNSPQIPGELLALMEEPPLLEHLSVDVSFEPVFSVIVTRSCHLGGECTFTPRLLCTVWGVTFYCDRTFYVSNRFYYVPLSVSIELIT